MQFKAGGNPGHSPTASAEVLADKISVSVSFPGADSDYQITEIIVSRQAGDRLGISAPNDFLLKPCTLEDTRDPRREASARWVHAANRLLSFTFRRDLRKHHSWPADRNPGSISRQRHLAHSADRVV